MLTFLLVAAGNLRAESKHIFGIHFWDWGASVDVMSQRTGWVVEYQSLKNGGGPNIGGRTAPATAQGFTIIQRLDWGDTLETVMPVTEADQDTFAQRCGSWANDIKQYCRTYTIGNEMEFVTGMNSTVYASGFTKVRNAIQGVQPEAKVIIGHWNNGANVRSVVQLLGRDGYDGVTVHTGSSVPTGMLDMLDEEDARPGVGVYITEWGWVADTNPNSMSVMHNFYLDLGASNASRSRQVYCACWYLYPGFLGSTFSLELAQIDNPAFEAATAIGTSVNSYADDPVVLSDLTADIPDSGVSAVINWTTNIPARTQLWWTLGGHSGSGYEGFKLLDSALVTAHSQPATALTPATVYEVMPCSTRDDYGDVGGLRYRVKTGPWAHQVDRPGRHSLRMQWATDWPATSRVEYGPTQALGQSVEVAGLVTNHSVTLDNLAFGPLYYRFVSAEPPPEYAPGLAMRSPIRSMVYKSLVPGDWDQDGDVDVEDFGRFQACLTEAGVPQEDPACFLAQLDADTDVDADDTAIFVACLTAPGIEGDPQCAP